MLWDASETSSSRAEIDHAPPCHPVLCSKAYSVQSIAVTGTGPARMLISGYRSLVSVGREGHEGQGEPWAFGDQTLTIFGYPYAVVKIGPKHVSTNSKV